MSRVESRRTRTTGLVALGVGAVLVLVSFMNITITDRVIDTTFTVEAGESYNTWESEGLLGLSPYNDGIWYSPHGPCVLEGQVAVEGEGIYVATHEFFVHEIEGSFADGDFTFTLDPANAGVYFFTFDNRAGDAESHVTFVLDETRTGSPFQLLMWSSLPYPIRFFFLLLAVFLPACLLPYGFTLIVWEFIRARIRRRRRARLRKLALGE